ncbi:MAG: hypothetical protein JOY93_10685, partial [Acidobacteriales bacterium]|nr:hypothetical protein [Terriglobales bacterium]
KPGSSQRNSQAVTPILHAKALKKQWNAQVCNTGADADLNAALNSCVVR